jgi:putative Mn2+ efflux pump MntP
MFANDKKNSFIFVDEFEDKTDVFSSIILIIVGLFIVYKGLKKELS